MKRRAYIRDGRAPIPRSALTSRIMSSIRGKDTKPEISLRKALWGRGHKGYRLHWSNIPGRPDIAFPGKKIAIFVNGCYWHQCPYCKPASPKSHRKFWKEKFEKNKKRDKIKNKQLRNCGWHVRTVWECQIKRDVGNVVSRVEDILR